MQSFKPQDSVLQKSEPIHILIVEDQEVLRLGLKLGFSEDNDLDVVGEASDGVSAVTMAESLKPDIVLMDIDLPLLDGIQATREIKRKTDCKILVLSGHNEDEWLYPALDAGADGFCLKDISKNSLQKAVKTVYSGETWIDKSVAGRVLNHKNTSSTESDDNEGTLCTRELKILSLILQGKSPEIIANEMSVSMKKVFELTNTVLEKASHENNRESQGTDINNAKKRISLEHKIAKRCSQCHSKVPIFLERCPEDGNNVVFDELIGSTFANRYEILSLLGAGTSGSVYKAKHKYMGTFVAIKILHSEYMNKIDIMQRFRQEAVTVGQLHHPNVVSVFDFGLSDTGNAFMVMEYSDATNLDEIIEEKVQLDPVETIKIAIQICKGMQAAHNKGILHRDLKPSNILVSNYKKPNMVVKIADFGTAKILSDKSFSGIQCVVTRKGQLFGTPLFMSPEQCLDKEITAASDIYSLGCLLYYALSGLPPIIGNDFVDVMYKHINDEPKNLANCPVPKPIPSLFQGIVMKSLQKKAEDRYKSMNEMLAYLTSIPLDSPSKLV